MYMYMFLMRDEKEERKKQARSNKQTNKAKQHSTPKAVKKLPRVGLEPTTLYTLDRALYQLSYTYMYMYVQINAVYMYTV